MEIINRIPRMRMLSRKLRRDNRKIGFVPTMGALHDGHLSLIRRAQQMSDVVIVSIFINPIQFGPSEDFEVYPRDLARDAEQIANKGVDYLFAPSIDEMYPEDFMTYVVTENLSSRLCGASRPGHFRGVTTIVNKLFNIITPDFAFFGQKDAQQVIIIQRMVRDLCMDTEVVVCPIIREVDGIAMSSRNQYLDPEERQAGLVLYRSIELARNMYLDGERDCPKIVGVIRELIEKEPLARIDYVAAVDVDTLEPLNEIDDDTSVLIALAVFIGRTRLIDNTVLKPEIEN
ncbi:MAG TPA: pantoate--beta-alanine ligase [Acidobacteriota bacterium]|nr:pantoate--beta-alanine ligase [Acidobacteriota bacterium]HND22051.1 pantoate--beta-alanine ligase [Acidobacteriota bacterium]